ncbi:MAG TPA: ergothioneine biosynthesis glutamate--cysteine ligase EgtA, partial [Pseudonocardia sp.]
CFKHGPPRLLGVELEWLLERPSGARLDLDALAGALGPHSPTTLDPRSPALPLPRGSLVTAEPGGQVELASPALPDLAALFETVEADRAELHQRLAGRDLRPRPWAADPVGPPQRLLSTPRYVAMETAFDRSGHAGRDMMCSTAAVQPCFDTGERDDVWRRWTLLHAAGPVLLGVFANSPVLNGRRTGWRSSRMACWWALDACRTAPPELTADDPAQAYARRAMDAYVLCVRRENGAWDTPVGVSFAAWLAGALPTPPTTADLDLHLSTLFPPVRAHGHLEVRYLDAQPGPEWVVPVAVLTALLSDPVSTTAALEACLPVSGRWVAAARDGLGDPALAAAARTVFDLARSALPGLVGPGPVRDLVERVAEHRVARGRCTADETEDARARDEPGGRR